MTPRLAHVESWIFDLDNSLYPASTDLFALIDIRMGAIHPAAARLRTRTRRGACRRAISSSMAPPWPG